MAAASSSLHGQPLCTPSNSSLRLRIPLRRDDGRGVVKASGAVVLVEKTEAEKRNRLKGVYLGKVPKLEKIVVNCGIGDTAHNAKGLDAAMNDMALITGQRPVKTHAKNSVAAFKIREGQPLGIAVTL